MELMHSSDSRIVPCVPAHTPGPSGRWHELADHSRAVAVLAARFAAPFHADRLARVLGAWHDIGKVNPDFRAYLEACAAGRQPRKVPHAIWGAALAYHLICERCKEQEAWKDLALTIAAHHSYLEHPGTLAQKLCEFLSKHRDALKLMRGFIEKLPIPTGPIAAAPHERRDLFIRMVFSSLVDADYLDTEQHFEPALAATRGEWTRPSDLWHVFRPDQLRAMWNGRGTSRVNRIRRQIYRDCIRAARRTPGVFRLTVPTGGGKTRSALAFALRHAFEHKHHGFRRVIVALPYTSIIDQTAAEYRRIFGDRLVLEHHSMVNWPDGELQDEESIRQRLAAENWEHPLIVTTTVQLFESLFAHKPGRCRKLHNVARSIIILDEIQSLPPELLRPTLDILRLLSEHYGVSVVFSSATQPVFEKVKNLEEFHGIQVHEIVPGYEEHFDMLKRVHYHREGEPLDWPEVAARIRKLEHVMVVLNSRKDALALLDELGETEGVFHLSTLLCGAHRRRVLDAIRQRLDPRHPKFRPGPVRLVATQVVEAGVDLDFPEVWRAMGPLERIVQAAGRCNREGRLDRGRVVIFDPAVGRMPRGSYKLGFEKARLLLQDHDPETLHCASLHQEYFCRVHSDADDTKAKRIQSAREALDFPAIANEYRLIEEETVPVVVDYRTGFKRLRVWRRCPSRENWRRLQPFVVSLCGYEARGFEADGWLEPVTDSLWRWRGDYDGVRGIRAQFDVTDLIVSDSE